MHRGWGGGYAACAMGLAVDDGADGADGVLRWIPAPALHVRDGAVVAANGAAERFAPAERDGIAATIDGVTTEPLLVRLGDRPPHRFAEVEAGPHPDGGLVVVIGDVTERERLDAVIAEFATGVYITDASLEATWIPRRTSESVGLPRDRFVGHDVYDLVHPGDRAVTRKVVAHAREMPGVRTSLPMRVRQFDQPDVWWPIVAHLIWRGDDPAIGGLLVRFDIDVTGGAHERRAEETAQALVTLGPTSATGALHLGLDGRLLQRSTRVREILRPVGEDADQRWLDLLRPEDRAKVTERVEAARTGALLPPVEVAFVEGDTAVWTRLDVMPYRGTEGRVAGMFVNVLDLTSDREAREELALAREELWHLANHDALTGLANRYQLADRLAAAVDEPDGQSAVIVADLDRFKDVNDGHGHRIGDEVLAEAARRIAAAVRPEDLVCRFGGDEFVVLCEHIGVPEELDAVCCQLVDRFAEPFEVDGLTFEVGVSLGTAVAEPGDEADPERLILRADRAMYAAKDAARSAG